MAAIGIARAHDADLLSAAGADIVVTALDEVDLAALSDGRLATKGQSPGLGVARLKPGLGRSDAASTRGTR